MSREPENISINISLSFTGFSGKPIFTGASIPVAVPKDYTIGKLLNAFSCGSHDIDLNCDADSNEIKRVATEFRVKSKLEKNNIRVNVSGTNRFYSISTKIEETNIHEDGTFTVILPRMPCGGGTFPTGLGPFIPPPPPHLTNPHSKTQNNSFVP